MYTLTYDLRKQRNYQEFYDELEKFGAVRILESTWCFCRFNTDAENLRNHFKQFIDGDDGIFVAKFDDWATSNTDGNPKQLS